jgi:hypothetical protein
MARSWKPTRAHDAPRAPTTIHEIARRYHACAVALGQTLGLSLAEGLAQHRESVTAVFIECGRCDLCLPGRVRSAASAATASGQRIGWARITAGMRSKPRPSLLYAS